MRYEVLFVLAVFSFVLMCVFGLLEYFAQCGVNWYTDPEVELLSVMGALARVSRCVRNWYPCRVSKLVNSLL